MLGKDGAPKKLRPFRLLLVAERPGNSELRKKHPLAGRSGWRIFKTLLDEAGIEEAEVWTDNATVCSWREYVTDASWNKTIACCSGRLLRRVAELAKETEAAGQKLLVLVLGDKSIRSISKHKSVGKWGGYPILPEHLKPGADIPGVIYFPTFHPSRVLREPFLLPVLRLDVARAVAYASGTLTPEAWCPILTGSGTAVEDWLERVVKRASSEPTTLGIDIETAGKEPLLAPTICVGIADEGSAISFPLTAGPELLRKFRRLYSHPNVTFVLQNGNHDTIGLQEAGFGLPANTVDILNAARVLFPSIDHDLQSLIRYFMFIEKHKLMYKDDKGSEVFAEAVGNESLMSRLMSYNAKDAWTQLQVWLRMKHMLEGEV